VNREQLLLRSAEVEKLVEEDHPVRAIWELVDRADLESFYETIEAVEGEAGCSAWDPRVLISLWLDAYSRAVSSGLLGCTLFYRYFFDYFESID
jgi:transposase